MCDCVMIQEAVCARVALCAQVWGIFSSCTKVVTMGGPFRTCPPFGVPKSAPIACTMLELYFFHHNFFHHGQLHKVIHFF